MNLTVLAVNTPRATGKVDKMSRVAHLAHSRRSRQIHKSKATLLFGQNSAIHRAEQTVLYEIVLVQALIRPPPQCDTTHEPVPPNVTHTQPVRIRAVDPC